MEIGIYDIDSTELSIKERFKIYKDVGFTHVGFYFDNSYLKENETYLEMIKEAKEVGLKLSQVHLDYKNTNMLSMNNDNEFINYLEIKANEAISYGIKDLVLHASKGNEPPLISKYSLRRIKKIANKVKDYDVRLCFENVRDNKNLDLIMKLDASNICVCYDTGHGHCYLNEEEFIKKYEDRIVTTHVHDNFKEDTHDLIGKGNIDWKAIASLLKETKREIDYLECFPPRGSNLNEEDFKWFIKQMYDSYKLYF